MESFVDGQRTRLPNTDIIYQMSGNPSPKTKAIPGAVMVSSRQLPLDLLAPFIIAEKPFLADVTQYCDQIVFMPFIEHNGEWSQGFVGQGREIARALDVNDPGKTMFVNLYDNQAARFEAENMHWAISPLLASMKLGQLIEMIGVPEASPALVDYYLCQYQGNLLTRIRDSLLAQDPNYPGSPLHQFHQREIELRHKIAYDAALKIGPREANLLPALE